MRALAVLVLVISAITVSLCHEEKDSQRQQHGLAGRPSEVSSTHGEQKIDSLGAGNQVTNELSHRRRERDIRCYCQKTAKRTRRMKRNGKAPSKYNQMKCIKKCHRVKWKQPMIPL